jgi:hypothetical protein
MFKMLPDVKMRWSDVIIGSFLTSLLFILGKYGLSLYFGKADPASAYGAAGSIVLILLWASYSSMIVFFGAEFTKQYAMYHGHEILPSANAEKISQGDTALEQEHKAAEKKAVEVKEKYNVKEESPKHIYAMKSKGEVKAEIMNLERRLKDDKGEIKDNLLFRHFFSGLFKVHKKKKYHRSADEYLKHIAKTHISLRENKSWAVRLKEALHIKKKINT